MGINDRELLDTLAIREIEPTDWPELKRVRLKALADSPDAFCSSYQDQVKFPDAEWQKRACSWHEDPDTGFFLVFDQSVCMGIAGVYRNSDQESISHAYSVWIEPDLRGTGLATRLMERLEDWSRSNGMPIMEADVTDMNPQAIAFYMKIGFKETGESDAYPLNDCARTLRIRKDLE